MMRDEMPWLLPPPCFPKASLVHVHGFLPRLVFRGFASSVSAAFSPAARIELSQTEVFICDKELTIIQPKNVDQVLDMYIEQGRLDGDPYWCRIWPSAIVLAEEIFKNPQLVAKLDVCDLGAGLGLAGLSAITAGASEVMFYDQEPLALLCSLLTVQANFPSAVSNLPVILQIICGDEPLDYQESASPLVKSISSLSSTVSHTLIKQDMKIEEGSKMTARAEIFNWCRKEKQNHKFDTVLACDILYEKLSVPFVAELLPTLLLPNKSGKVLMTDPTHRTPQNRNQFLDLLHSEIGSKGLKLEKRERQERKTNGRCDAVELLHFSSHQLEGLQWRN